MIDPTQFKTLVIRPTLAQLPDKLRGPAAENLLLGTALTESGLTFLDQLGQVVGGGMGLYQDEPEDHDDLWANFLKFNVALSGAVQALCSGYPRLQQLITNLAYATAVCRCHYYRAPDPLPAADDAIGMAAYHKRFYNTIEGATDPAVSVANFKRAISA